MPYNLDTPKPHYNSYEELKSDLKFMPLILASAYQIRDIAANAKANQMDPQQMRPIVTKIVFDLLESIFSNEWLASEEFHAAMSQGTGWWMALNEARYQFLKERELINTLLKDLSDKADKTSAWSVGNDEEIFKTTNSNVKDDLATIRDLGFLTKAVMSTDDFSELYESEYPLVEPSTTSGYSTD